MSYINVPVYNPAGANPLLAVTDSNTASAAVLRDASGNINASAITGTSLVTTGNLNVQVQTLTTTATVGGTGSIFIVDGTSAIFTVTLPAAAASTNLVYIFIKKDSAHNVTIKGNASENINGSNTSVMSSQYGALRLVCDGTQWWTF